MFMELLTLPFRSFKWAIDLIIRQPRQVEEPTEPFPPTSPDQLAESSPDMGHKKPTEHTVDNSKRVRGSYNEEREGHLRTPAKATTRGRHLEAQSVLLSQQVERVKDLENSHRQLYAAHQVVKTELHETQTTCKNQQQEIHSLKEKLRDTSALLGARNQELKVAKTFLSKEDAFSTSDVVQNVRDLNSEVMQTAARLADKLALKRSRGCPAGFVPEGPYRSIYVLLAWPQGSGEEVDAGLLELALQGFLIISVYFIANAWGLCQESGCGELYSKVCENGTLFYQFSRKRI